MYFSSTLHPPTARPPRSTHANGCKVKPGAQVASSFFSFPPSPALCVSQSLRSPPAPRTPLIIRLSSGRSRTRSGSFPSPYSSSSSSNSSRRDPEISLDHTPPSAKVAGSLRTSYQGFIWVTSLLLSANGRGELLPSAPPLRLY